MLPTTEMVAEAAFYRWQRRGFEHGKHVHDWLAAERELTFALNYEVIASYRLDGVPPQLIGDEDELRCRFCEATPPRATFEAPRLAVPAFLGNESLRTHEVCDDCFGQHSESLGTHLKRFVASAMPDRGNARERSFEPIAAFKGLVRSALAVVPESELQYFEDAIEWLGNPDHDLDSRSIGGLECVVHTLDRPSPFSWAATARRVDDSERFPYLLGFFATDRSVFQVPLPLCVLDEDLEASWEVPPVASPFGVGRGPLDGRFEVVSLAPKGGRMAFAGR